MKVLVLEQTSEMAELLGIYLAALSSAEVKATHMTHEAIDLIKHSGFSVVLSHVSFTAPGSDLALKTWRESCPGSPMVFLGDGLPQGDYPVAYKVSHLHMVQELRDMVKHPFWRRLEGTPVENPLPLSPYLVYRLGTCPSDLFLRLGTSNWVKLFHKGSPFGEIEREKFEAKGLSEFWVLPEDIGQALGYFEDLLSGLSMASGQEGTLVSDATELVWHLVSQSGFREEVQEVVKAAMQQTLALTRKNPNLKEYMEKVLRSEHAHLVRHSMITAHIACAISTELGWTSEQTYLKLTVAALMHDVLLPSMNESEEVWLTAVAGEKQQNLSPEMRAFLQHPIEGAELIRRFREIPPDTDKIVLEHHELPEGSGFPRRLTASQISPLGCLFILSHTAAEVLLKLTQEKRPWALPILLERLNPERWQTGNFKKIWQNLEKTQFFS